LKIEQIQSSDLKTILHSKRANIYFLEHCRILVNGGRVEYVTDAGRKQLYWNIPIANTTTILLGNGTSLTQAAMRELAKAGVMVGFSGGGGTPLFAGTDVEIAVSWLSPQSEYRPTEYLQNWVRFWFDDSLRLEAAKEFQFARLAWLKKIWTSPRKAATQIWEIKPSELDDLISKSLSNITNAPDHSHLLTEEARLTKQLYKIACRLTQYGDFTRSDRGESTDSANRFLDHGNYLAYGLGATATWVLGIPHGLAVLHGKTRRGGLVFDVADLVKDAIILPQAFISAAAGDSEQEFRQACIETLTKTEALDFQIDTLKDIALKLGRKAMVSKE
jgi:CRISP-associated protein Cas1